MKVNHLRANESRRVIRRKAGNPLISRPKPSTSLTTSKPKVQPCQSHNVFEGTLRTLSATQLHSLARADLKNLKMHKKNVQAAKQKMKQLPVRHVRKAHETKSTLVEAVNKINNGDLLNTLASTQKSHIYAQNHISTNLNETAGQPSSIFGFLKPKANSDFDKFKEPSIPGVQLQDKHISTVSGKGIINIDTAPGSDIYIHISFAYFNGPGDILRGHVLNATLCPDFMRFMQHVSRYEPYRAFITRNSGPVAVRFVVGEPDKDPFHDKLAFTNDNFATMKDYNIFLQKARVLAKSKAEASRKQNQLKKRVEMSKAGSQNFENQSMKARKPEHFKISKQKAELSVSVKLFW